MSSVRPASNLDMDALQGFKLDQNGWEKSISKLLRHTGTRWMSLSQHTLWWSANEHMGGKHDWRRMYRTLLNQIGQANVGLSVLQTNLLSQAYQKNRYGTDAKI